MSDLKTIRITYSELRNGDYLHKYVPQDDKFETAVGMTDSLRKAMLKCPNNKDDNKTAMFIVVDGSKEVGRCFMFGTKLKTPDGVHEAQVLYGLEALEEYRNQGAGTLLMMFPLSSKEYDFLIAGDTTSVVAPMYEKLKYMVFEIHQYAKLCNPQYILIPLGFKGWILKLASGISKIPLKAINFANTIREKRLHKNFIVCQETTIPDWAGEIATNDGHEYMEVHDRDWLQWCLDNHVHDYKEDRQAFFAIYDNQHNPQGFFMIKERFVKNAGRIKNYIRGKVVEWGTKDNCQLNEANINLLALSKFSPQVDVIEIDTNDSNTASKLKRMGFVRRDVVRMAIKDKRGKLKEANNPTKWRLRYGMANSIIY